MPAGLDSEQGRRSEVGTTGFPPPEAVIGLVIATYLANFAILSSHLGQAEETICMLSLPKNYVQAHSTWNNNNCRNELRLFYIRGVSLRYR
jgi:hypothetical protein